MAGDANANESEKKPPAPAGANGGEAEGDGDERDEGRTAPFGWVSLVIIAALVVGTWFLIQRLSSDASMQDCVQSGRRKLRADREQMTGAARVAGTLVLLALPFALTACAPEAVSASHAPAPGAASKRRLVHVDHVDPAKVTAFEDARRQLLAAYAARSIDEGTTTILETKDDLERPEFLSLRPFGPYADLDRLNDAAATRAVALGKDLDRLDALTHATLVPPHASEIWLARDDLSYAAPGAPTEATAPAARLSRDVVSPADGDDYERAAKDLVAALRRASSPVARLAFTSSYGTGEYVTLWLAQSPADLDALASGDVGKAVDVVRGKTQKSSTRVAFVRRELSTR
jgi:hypothetical protein